MNTTLIDRDLQILIGASFVLHLLFILFGSMFTTSSTQIDEWEIETEIADIMIPIDKSAIKNSEKAKEAAVPVNLLPQLPKNVTLKEEAIEEGLKPSDKKVNDKKNNKDPNALKKQDLLRRQSLERLRKLQKNDKKIKSELDSELSKLKNRVKSTKNLQVTGTAGTYAGVLKNHIYSCYSVPSAYNSGGRLNKTSVAIIVKKNGTIQKSWVTKSSGSSALDGVALKAIESCSPVPQPPKQFIGKKILFNFDPSSL